MKLYASLCSCPIRCDLCAEPCDGFHSPPATAVLFIANELCSLNFLASLLQMFLF